MPAFNINEPDNLDYLFDLKVIENLQSTIADLETRQRRVLTYKVQQVITLIQTDYGRIRPRAAIKFLRDNNVVDRLGYSSLHELFKVFIKSERYNSYNGFLDHWRATVIEDIIDCPRGLYSAITLKPLVNLLNFPLSYVSASEKKKVLQLWNVARKLHANRRSDKLRRLSTEYPQEVWYKYPSKIAIDKAAELFAKERSGEIIIVDRRQFVKPSEGGNATPLNTISQSAMVERLTQENRGLRIELRQKEQLIIELRKQIAKHGIQPAHT